MFGPKLDARSYAILILVVIAALIGGNLVAQTKSTSQSTAELAAATAQVASATQQIADSNAQIAQAIQELASAVREAGKQKADSSSGGSYSSGDEIEINPENANPDRSKGVFQLQ